MTVDEALLHADQRLDMDCRTLASEVRRLRAMVELTQDARELAQLIRSHFRASMNQVSSTPGANPELDGAAQLISTYRARLLDEAAERAVAWLLDGFAREWLSEDAEDTLRAAVRGKE